MKMRLGWMGLYLSVLLFCVCPMIQAEPIKIATGNKFAPFSDENLPQGGLATEIIKTTFKAMEHETQIDFLPWKRGFIATQKNQYFGTYPYSYNEERSKEFYYSTPIYNQVFVFFVKNDSKIRFETAKDLQGLRVCKPLGYNKKDIQPFLDKKILTLHEPADLEACFKLILKGRDDLVSINKDVGWATIQRTFGQKDQFKTLAKEVDRNGVHLIVSKTYPGGKELLEKFNQKYEQLEKEGVIQKIIERHLR